ncbi:Gfo/Idh/MocA family oxidoreductase [Streptomyces lincolnensis]|uniref:Gfo/Idh/MocA family oxidoreductase n=1 Tax=Streptomyces lincolnensis TaxID=1915 RepID=UPI0037D658D8
MPIAPSFAATHDIDLALGSTEQFLARPDVDVVYVATPQSEHLAIGLAAIAAGKHVLIEKLITASADEAKSRARWRGAGVVRLRRGGTVW